MITQNTQTQTPAAREAAGARLRNVQAFEKGMDALRRPYPGLRMERSGASVEWFLRASRPLASDGLAIPGSLSLDMPCDEDTAELLDAMAFANDPSLGRKAMDTAVRGEASFLNRLLGNAVDLARTLARRDLAVPGIRKDAYLSALGRDLGRMVELFTQDGDDYNPGKDLRDRVRAACASALKASKAHKDEPRPARSGKGRSRRQDTARSRAPARPGRPFRMRRWSAIYPD